MVGNVTWERYGELVASGGGWVETMRHCQFRLGDAAMEIELMRRHGGAQPSGQDDLFSVTVCFRTSAWASTL
ncbi:hypothetical protein ACFYW6_06635 [Streptomyces sp. NPDC002659]|uniref:hypothetical protein n=1 Tax=Streptomyces sp. NPDC002659 TaxID=3364656 RepID=UPI0036971BE2